MGKYSGDCVNNTEFNFTILAIDLKNESWVDQLLREKAERVRDLLRYREAGGVQYVNTKLGEWERNRRRKKEGWREKRMREKGEEEDKEDEKDIERETMCTHVCERERGGREACMKETVKECATADSTWLFRPVWTSSVQCSNFVMFSSI